MSNCFKCVVDFSNRVSSQSFIKRGEEYFYFIQGIKPIVSVVGYPSQDSAHSGAYTNNYVTYRINGFHYKAHVYSSFGPNVYSSSYYVVFFKVKRVSGTGLNITQLQHNGDFSDFIIYKQPDDVIDYRYFKLRKLGNGSYGVNDIDVFCNKTFFVKPDEVFGVYYLGFRENNANIYFTINANISVYFDVV